MSSVLGALSLSEKVRACLGFFQCDLKLLVFFIFIAEVFILVLCSVIVVLHIIWDEIARGRLGGLFLRPLVGGCLGREGRNGKTSCCETKLELGDKRMLALLLLGDNCYLIKYVLGAVIFILLVEEFFLLKVFLISQSLIVINKSLLDITLGRHNPLWVSLKHLRLNKDVSPEDDPLGERPHVGRSSTGCSLLLLLLPLFVFLLLVGGGFSVVVGEVDLIGELDAERAALDPGSLRL